MAFAHYIALGDSMSSDRYPTCDVRGARHSAPAPGALVADVHRHFLRRGRHNAVAARWSWPRNLIEPNARGASEIRRVWWDVIGSRAG